MTPKFYGHAAGGKFIPEKPALVFAYLKNFQPETRLEVVIKKYRKKRSDNQNRYYWSCVVKTIADETGQDKDSVHDGLRQMFLKDAHEKLPTIKSTTKLSTVEFQEYIDACVLWAAEWLGIVVPEPWVTDY